MEDFYYAGGLRALLKALGKLIKPKARTVNGHTLGENIADAAIHNPDVIHTLDRPVKDAGGLAVLRGNLAPDGAVIKPSAGRSAIAQAYRCCGRVRGITTTWPSASTIPS